MIFKRVLVTSLLLILSYTAAFCIEIIGVVKDQQTNELLVGVAIYIKELNIATVSGLDGTFRIKNIAAGNYTLVCSYISYTSEEKSLSLTEKSKVVTVDYALKPALTELNEVIISAHRDQSSELSARSSERTSANLLNVVSARSIELSPDLNMANVVQRMSGVTLDKSASNSGQYALLRGMDKRYNYTLINGVKIPSTHNKHRYVSLDMFPSDMIDRVEVTKALTPNMEGDAIAGVVNLVMKNAPDKFVVQANLSTGYSSFFSKYNGKTFNTSTLNEKSPYELYPSGYRATANDFTTQNLAIKDIAMPINTFGNITIGNRFLKKKLGWIISSSYQNIYTGLNSLYFNDDLTRDGKNLPILTSMQERIYTENKSNIGVHNKFDYQFNAKQKLQLYIAYLNNNNTQVREIDNTDLSVSYDPSKGNINRTHSTRFRYNNQNLLNATLQGNHTLTKLLSTQWSVVYSEANNKTPDEATITYSSSLENFKLTNQYVDFDGSNRIWRRNSDKDKAAYLNFTYTPQIMGINVNITGGGLYREKKRTSFYNKYTLQAIVNVTTSDTSYTSYYSEKGKDWNTYQDIKWKVYNPRGTIAVGENYDAYENVAAGYAMLDFTINKLYIIGGVRIENTEQGYNMLFPIGEPQPDGKQNYTEALPSVHFKYTPSDKHNIRLSYYKAINKPGFQEIVPYIDVTEEPNSAGNKNLKYAIANNIDLRWEYFPNQLDQIMIGTFYKHIERPIEFAFDKFLNISQKIVYTPINSNNAKNYGIEIDVTKYYREWGIKANYTLTQSSISSKKLSRVKDTNGNDSTAYTEQKRPLFGQSAHVGNLSLLYKNTNNCINGQLAFSYTGERIYTVSRFINNDYWQEGYWQLDASLEKHFNNGISLFIKAQNMLNNHIKVYIKKTNSMNKDTPKHDSNDTNTLIRDEYSMSTFLIGLRYKL